MSAFTALIIVVICVALSAFFSAAETALMRLREHEIEEDIDKRHGPAALAVRDLVASTSRLLFTILLGSNIVSILGATVAAVPFVVLLGPEWGVVASAVVMTIVTFLFGEIVPKTIAAHHPRGVASFIAIPLWLFHQALRPFHIFMDRYLTPFLERMAGGTATEEEVRTDENLRLARQQAESDEKAPTGSLSAIIGAAAGAAEMTVSDIMVSRTEVTAF